MHPLSNAIRQWMHSTCNARLMAGFCWMKSQNSYNESDNSIKSPQPYLKLIIFTFSEYNDKELTTNA